MTQEEKIQANKESISTINNVLRDTTLRQDVRFNLEIVRDRIDREVKELERKEIPLYEAQNGELPIYKIFWNPRRKLWYRVSHEDRVIMNDTSFKTFPEVVKFLAEDYNGAMKAQGIKGDSAKVRIIKAEKKKMKK